MVAARILLLAAFVAVGLLSRVTDLAVSGLLGVASAYRCPDCGEGRFDMRASGDTTFHIAGPLDYTKAIRASDESGAYQLELYLDPAGTVTPTRLYMSLARRLRPGRYAVVPHFVAARGEQSGGSLRWRAGTAAAEILRLDGTGLAADSGTIWVQATREGHVGSFVLHMSERDPWRAPKRVHLSGTFAVD